MTTLSTNKREPYGKSVESFENESNRNVVEPSRHAGANGLVGQVMSASVQLALSGQGLG